MLTALVLVPLAGAALVLSGRRWSLGMGSRRIATLAASATLAAALSAWLLTALDGSVIVARWPWATPVGVPVGLQGDALGLSFALLSAVSTLAAVLLHPADESRRTTVQLAGLLAAGGAANLCFVAGDLVTFLAGWEAAALIPATVVAAGDRGDGAAIAAARRMTIYLFAGSIGLVLALAQVAVRHHDVAGTWSIAFGDLADVAIAPTAQPWLAAGLLAACLSRLPLVPLHGWVGPAVSAAPASAALLVVAVVAKTGLYGLLRIVWMFVPEALATFAPALVWLSIATLLHAGLGALLQVEARRLAAWLSIAGGAFACAGFAARALLTTTSPSLYAAAFGIGQALGAAALVAAAAMFEARRGPLLRAEAGGAAVAMPRWGWLLAAAALALAVAPVGVAFPAFVALMQTLVEAPLPARGSALALIATGAALWPIALASFVVTAFGRSPIDRNRALRDLSTRERAAALVLIAAIVLPGLAAMVWHPWERGGHRGATVEIDAGEER